MKVLIISLILLSFTLSSAERKKSREDELFIKISLAKYEILHSCEEAKQLAIENIKKAKKEDVSFLEIKFIDLAKLCEPAEKQELKDKCKSAKSNISICSDTKEGCLSKEIKEQKHFLATNCKNKK